MTTRTTTEGAQTPDVLQGPQGVPTVPGAVSAGGRPDPLPMSRRGEILYFALRTKKVIIGLAIIAFFLFIIVGVLVANFIVDIAYVIVDPRTRVAMSGAEE